MFIPFNIINTLGFPENLYFLLLIDATNMEFNYHLQTQQ